ncbi:metal ABC transporter ATP-binding protein [Peptoniphilus indolicus]|uniref:Zinc ABC superfamily ATP binding cassette transporter, ABC protein n=2 Tax=Peptoniphilus indolicus TaxID=33030 RepID=G4D629_9FIRM|nr:ATP-binding cassette domain-containing protein [Peptoniphilus indolicus]EGY77457.1 zinc ABC superfamily ATP binding cassette transporter, ABC protein [Peptoniphilus indolicus ATCC 29427]SUB74541.1 Glutamine transport ATP-binding protein GlnQ [Peptoniphilus indolicus]
MNIVEIKNLSFSYGHDIVLNNLNLNIKDGGLNIILGENGSGKSTLLKLILGELKVNSGSIKLFGEDISKFKNFEKIGYVPQIQVANQMAFPVTCLELVVLNLYRDFGKVKIPKDEQLRRAKEILIKMGLEKQINTPLNELSGGLKQRAMIARALINNPELLILDEPTAGIDVKSKEQFINILSSMQKDNITIMLVTHEMEFIEENLKEYEIFNLKGGSVC